MSSKLLKSTAVVSGMTLISRLLGFVRDMVIAVSFGASGLTDAFFVAFRIPNLLRRMFAEGAFAQAFVPVFTEYREQKNHAALQDLADHVAGTLGLILTGITLFGILAAPLLILLFAPGFSDDPERQQLATEMLRLTFPYVLFISLTALAGGILNSYGKFAVPAFTPVLLNLCLIAAAIWLAPLLEQPVVALAWGVLIAGLAQLAFQIPALWRIGLLPRPRWQRAHQGVHRVITLMLPALLGSSVAQINMLLNTVVASFLVSGSISWLYYSDRFVELPLSLFGIAIGTVILPKLSAEHSQRSTQAFNDTLDWALRFGLVIALPAMLGLILLSRPILTTLIQYGEFTAFDARMAAISLSVYALGLPGFVLVKILAPGFFSRQDTKTPVRIGMIAISVNITLYAVLVLPWILWQLPAPHAALAFCAALASTVNASLLFRTLRREKIYTPKPGWRKLLLQVSTAFSVMGIVVFLLTPAAEAWQSWHFAHRASILAGLMGVAILLYLITLRLAGVRPQQILHLR
ncbi:MAG TPA: murein biosynthesis integral membrane protein MurJ [Gammaproteobacteria bacterium]|nr:murein biosynthesis integral membrane protein MurJ [Gammaproteobacteria bacterium]